MHAIDSGGDGHVEPIVDKDFRPAIPRRIAHGANQIEKLAGLQILFANLDVIHTVIDCSFDMNEQIPLMASRNVTADHSIMPLGARMDRMR
jgi:hypothetical protein